MRFFTALAISVVSIPVASAEPLTFDQAPYVFAQAPARFQQLWHNAMTQTVRVALLGDSQETSPGGAGRTYVPRFGYELWRHYGNVPETQLVGHSSFGGSSSAEWLLRGSTAAPAPSATRLEPTQILPGISPRAHSTKNPSGNVNGQIYGQLSMLLHDAVLVDSNAQIPTTNSYFDATATVRAEVFAATHPESGGVYFRARPRDNNNPNFFEPQTTTGTLGLDLVSETYEIRSATTPPLDINGKKYLAIEVHGDDDDKLTDIVGLRFQNADDPTGVVVQDIAAGGYRIESFLNNQADAGVMFDALGFDVAILHFGANDSASGNGLNAEGFKADTLTLIERLRTWTGDEHFPVILMGDPYRENENAAEQAEFDRYAGMQFEIAQDDLDVMLVNSRRLTDDLGWSQDGDPDAYLADGVHYTGLGARELARLEVAAILGTTPGDANLDGEVSISDLSILASNFGTITGAAAWRDADFNADGDVTIGDLSILASNWGYSITGNPVTVSFDDALASVGSGGAVPEPQTALAFLTVAAGLCRKRVNRGGGQER